MIAIIDYGMGNLRSVQKACEKIGAPAHIATSPSDIRPDDKVILPGVGAFRDAIAELRRLHFDRALIDHIDAGRPLLGICLGLQLLFDVSYEDGEFEGLGVVPGKVVRFPSQPGLKIPHMGWNALQFQNSNPLLSSLPNNCHVYFVHSYYVVPEDAQVTAATTQHGVEFTSMICRNNLFATQFHPEKSQSIGLKLLENFAKLPEASPVS